MFASSDDEQFASVAASSDKLRTDCIVGKGGAIAGIGESTVRTLEELEVLPELCSELGDIPTWPYSASSIRSLFEEDMVFRFMNSSIGDAVESTKSLVSGRKQVHTKTNVFKWNRSAL